MMSLLKVVIGIALCAPLAQAQLWTATHERDTSSFFPIGVFNLHMARSAPPFLPITGVGSYNAYHANPLPNDIDAWIRRDTVLKALNINYVAGHIPRYYYESWTNMPETFEQIRYRRLMDSLGITMDLSQSLYWIEGARFNSASGPVLTDSSMRGAIRSLIYRSVNYPDTPNPLRHPCYPPGYNLGNDTLNQQLASEWDGWHQYIDNKLLQLHEEVSSSSTWSTLYVGEEADLFGFDCQHPLDWTRRSEEYIAARLHAVQYSLHAWDVWHPDPHVKPLVIVGSYEGKDWSLLQRVRDELLNARMVGMFSYPFCSALPGYPDSLRRITTYTGQKLAIDALRMRLDNFRNEFKDRTDLELWWFPQVYKKIDLNLSDWSFNGHRYPTYDEMRVQASLALSRGMKGIVWYLYGSQEDSVLNFGGRDPVGWEFGIVDGLTRTPIRHDKELAQSAHAQPHPWTLCPNRSIQPFDDLARVNAELARIGPVMRKYETVTVFDQQSIPPNCMGLTSVAADGAHADEALDISVMRRMDCDTCWALMLVNKVLNDTENPCDLAESKRVTVHFNTPSPFSIEDGFVASNTVDARFSMDEGQTITAIIEPGQARLFTLGNTGCKTFLAPEPLPDRTTLDVFPNPAATQATIRYTLTALSDVRLRVYNVIGQIIYQHDEYEQLPGSHEVPLRLVELPGSGIWCVRLEAGSTVISTYFVTVR